ncbi:carbonate dehydratase [Massilia sp. WF1]|uniref:carbonic anhydrase n=1 Tax=unclassified Massilia TaxID=2609279 RepID=UPI000649F839|nr:MULTISPECIES: carbonic anhydrase family protein [unclassified Massilia]ALK98811.1 carbonate dehydratase [Massilia sp. WG5]KLU38642.1 carbonate dehydratase [Massilia sp. WF1]
MRNLIALFACSCVVLSASANDPAPAAAAKLAASISRPASASLPAAKEAPSASKEAPARKEAPPKKAAPAPAAAEDKEQEAEVALSAKIAERLAELRERQQARAAASARVKKAAEAKRRDEEKAAAAAAILAAAPKHGTVWSYEGETGPANWSKINVDWAKCGMGNRQSPIDLRDGIKVNLEQIGFDYHPSSFNEVNNGHTIQVTVGGGNFITVGNQTYELQQFHFHRPSEERINGKGTEMVMHLVHKSYDGKIAIVAVLLERGQPHGLMQTIWDNLPLEKNEVVSPSIVLDPSDALPEKREYFTYMGSLSEPPCTEGVLWLVFKQPRQASPAQMALFSRLYPLNARPVQSTAGRMIKESN